MPYPWVDQAINTLGNTVATAGSWIALAGVVFTIKGDSGPVPDSVTSTKDTAKKDCDSKCKFYKRRYMGSYYPKHGDTLRIEIGVEISRAPSNGQAILLLAVPLGGKSDRLIGYDPVVPAHVAVFDLEQTWEWPECTKDYHGHVPTEKGRACQQINVFYQ